MKNVKTKLNLDKMAVAKLNESITTQVKGGRSLLCFRSLGMSRRDLACGCSPR